MKKIDIKDAILTAVKNCEHICNGDCGDCPFDEIRFNRGFGWCKYYYKESLRLYIEEHMVPKNNNKAG